MPDTVRALTLGAGGIAVVGVAAARLMPAALPCLLFVVAPAAVPAFALCAEQPDAMRRRNARGLCVRCGYDRRETPQRCPECGTEVA